MEREMDFSKYRRVAKAYYNNLSNEKQQQAKVFFDTLDKDKNGTVSIHEYTNFIKEDGFDDSGSLFKLLDKNGDGKLNFEECITLYYVAKAPPARTSFTTCNDCKAYMWEIYFTCVACYRAGKETYNLCCDCYGKKNFNHDHTTFWDNFKLLAYMQPEPEAEEPPSQGNTDGAAQVNSSITRLVDFEEEDDDGIQEKGNRDLEEEDNDGDIQEKGNRGKNLQPIGARKTSQKIRTYASSVVRSLLADRDDTSETCTIM